MKVQAEQLLIDGPAGKIEVTVENPGAAYQLDEPRHVPGDLVGVGAGLLG